MKTAVEWFALELYEKFEMKGNGKVFDELLEKAKEMEKANENRLNERWAQMRHDSRIVGEKVAINWMLQIYCDVEFTEELGNEVFEEFKRYFKPQ